MTFNKNQNDNVKFSPDQGRDNNLNKPGARQNGTDQKTGIKPNQQNPSKPGSKDQQSGGKF